MSVSDAVRLAVWNSLALSFDRLLVCLDVEVDEENQVAREQQASKDGSGFSARTATKAGQVREVVRGIVVIGCNTCGQLPLKMSRGEGTRAGKVHCEQVDNELYNLHGSEVLLPL